MKRLFLFLLFLLLCSPLASASTHFKPVATAEAGLNGKIFVNDSAAGYSAEWIADDRIAITSIIHETDKAVRIKLTALQNVNGWSSASVKVSHKNDAGVIDSERIVNFGTPDAQGFVTFTTDFSTVIIGGAPGTISVSSPDLSASDVMNLGFTLNGSDVSAFNVDVTDDATKSHPYDINRTGLVGEWLLDDNYTDTSGNGNNGTPFNGPVFAAGKYGNGTLLDGIDDYIDLGTDPVLDTLASITIEAWINPSSFPSNINIYAKGFWLKNGSRLLVTVGGQILYQTYTDTKLFSTNTPVGIVISDVLQYIVVSRNGTAAKIYLNGESVSTLHGTHVQDVSNISAKIGRFNSAGESFEGVIDTVRVYDRALSPVEIKSNYIDKLQQLQVNTNANATLSDYWNSTADNPLGVPFSPLELIQNLSFTVPDTVTQNNIIIHDYTNTTQFDVTATIHTGNDYYNISETAAAGTYTLQLNMTPAYSGIYWINWTTENTLLLNADFTNPATFSSNETNATLAAETLPSLNISTGYMQAGIPKTFNISIDYFDPPASFSVIESSSTWINTSWAESPNADKYSLYRDDVFITNTTNLYYTYTGLSPFVGYMLNVSVWNGSRETSQASLLEYTVSPTSTIITFLDLMNNSDTEFSIYNASGAAVVTLFSNGSSHTFPPGAYVVQVLPANAGYATSPLMLFDLLFAAIQAVVGIVLVLAIALGLGRSMRIIMEARV